MRGDEGIAPYIIQFKRPCKLKFITENKSVEAEASTLFSRFI